jgi:hypothetical protein
MRRGICKILVGKNMSQVWKRLGRCREMKRAAEAYGRNRNTI